MSRGRNCTSRSCACADLPPDVLEGRILPSLDLNAHLALFRCGSHALSRAVLLRTPGNKRLSGVNVAGRTPWSPALADLLGTKWQPLDELTDLELRLSAERKYGHPTALPTQPPAPSITRHVSRLHLSGLDLGARSLAGWRLHDAALWPHLQHLVVLNCRLLPATTPPLPAIPQLLTFTWGQGGDEGTAMRYGPTALLTLAADARHLCVARPDTECTPGTMEAVALMRRLTHADLAPSPHHSSCLSRCSRTPRWSTWPWAPWHPACRTSASAPAGGRR